MFSAFWCPIKRENVCVCVCVCKLHSLLVPRKWSFDKRDRCWVGVGPRNQEPPTRGAAKGPEMKAVTLVRFAHTPKEGGIDGRADRRAGAARTC